MKAFSNQVDLVEYAEKYTELTKQGEVYRGICPICHHGNESEFVVYGHKTYHCWVCGSSGDIINFIRDKYHIDFYAAVERLADELNIDIKHDKSYTTKKETVNFRETKALEAHKRVNVVFDYLTKERALTKETIEYFKLGADSRGNVTIPFCDANGRYIGWATRRFEGTPKYTTNRNDDLFTKSEFLYNRRGAKKYLTNRLYLVEGFFCAMSLHQEKRACVSYNSSQPTKQHLQQIEELRKIYPEMVVTLIPDNDGVAYDLVEKVRKNILSYTPSLPVEVLLLPEKIKDVNEYFSKKCGDIDSFEALPHESIDLFVLKAKLARCASLAAERQVVEEYAKSIGDSLTLYDIAEYLTKRWEGVNLNTILDFLHVSKEGLTLESDLKDPEKCAAEALRMLKTPSLQFGFPLVDSGVRGVGRKKNVTIIGACSGVGKTYITVGMAADMVIRQRKNVLYFSMEMSAGALYERVLGWLLEKSADIVDQMLLANDTLALEAIQKLGKYLYVVDKNGLTMDEINTYVREANAKKFDGNLDCVFIDYLQYMKGMSTYETFADTVKGLKPLAKNNQIHVVALSQLNREAKPWERPDMGKLKGGGDLEASADEIFLMWRPGLDPSLLPEEAKIQENIIKLRVAKARSGARISEVSLKMDTSRSRIVPLAS